MCFPPGPWQLVDFLLPTATHPRREVEIFQGVVLPRQHPLGRDRWASPVARPCREAIQMFSPIPAWMPGASSGFPDAVAVAAPSLPPSDTHLAPGELVGKGPKAEEGRNLCRHPRIRGMV